MQESLGRQPALHSITLIHLEQPEANLEATLLEPQQSTEATAEQATFLRKAGARAMKAVGLVEDKIAKAAIYTQIKTWDAVYLIIAGSFTS